MLDKIAAEHAGFTRGIEQRQVRRDLQAVQRGGILGVQKTGVAHGHEGSFAAPLEACAGKLRDAGAGELPGELDGVRARQQHAMNQMATRRLVRQHMRKEQSLVDLDAVLVALLQ